MNRSTSLDSLRGIAAVIVVAHHCSLMFAGGEASHASIWHGGIADPWSWVLHTPLHLLVAGKAAVLVFFVLSGFVLTPMFEGRLVIYAGFATRRFIRIWAPFAVAILISLAFQAALSHVATPDRPGWFARSWTTPPSVRVALEHLALTGRTIELDVPMWSLVHEMRISLIFPLVVWLAGRWPRLSTISTAALSLAASKVLAHVHFFPVAQTIETLGYAVFFVAGSAAAFHREALDRAVEALRPRGRALLWIGALATLLLCPASQIQSMRVGDAIGQLVAGCGALAIVLLCRHQGAVQRELSRPVPAWLGRISYSLYLIHIPILLIVGHAFPRLDALGVVVIGAPIAFAAAELLHRWVEQPSIRASRAAEAWINSLPPLARLQPH